MSYLGGRKYPDKREYFIEKGDGFDDILIRCQNIDGCHKCKTQPVAVLQKQRDKDSRWVYLACPKHPKNRTYLNVDYKAMFRAWQWLQQRRYYK